MLSDPIIIYFVVCAFVALGFGMLMTLVRLPVFTGYILAGALLGPHGLAFLADLELINQLGSIGVVLLLFFIGMEVSPRQLVSSWRITVVGTLLQVGTTVAVVSLIGLAFNWPLPRMILIGFVISLSCTAVVVDYLKARGEMGSTISQNVIGILVVQDLLVIPMLVILGMLGGEGVGASTLWRQALGSVFILLVMYWLMQTKPIFSYIVNYVQENPELQLLFALLLCFAFAFVTGVMHLSTALGAFLAGMLVGKIRDASWIGPQLESIKTIFVALFFASVGALLNPRFLAANWLPIALLVALVFVANTAINAGILRFLRIPAREAIYGGALLAHVGEFSFVLAAIGLNAGIVGQASYQITVAVISLSLLIGPLWVVLIRMLMDRVR